MADKKYNTVFLQEKSVLGRVLKSRRGNDLLQIGKVDDICFTENACVSRKFFLDGVCHAHHEMPFIQAQSDCLPVQSESIDIVLLIHQLEMAKNPMAILQETYRILRPNGQLIITGFNRWSLRQLFHRQENFNSTGKIKRYLRKLHFEITQHQTFHFYTPFLFLETLGQLFLPYSGAAFMIIATKNISGVTPLVASLNWQEV